jgi:CheY-like chemotaxis protein
VKISELSTEPALRINPENRLHHLWNNHGTWWCHYTVHHADFTKQRVRISLETDQAEEAIARRDCLLRRINNSAKVSAVNSILLLEDSLVTQEVIRRGLNQHFPEAYVIGCKNLAEAQTAISELVVDIIISDVQLPDGNGIDFLNDAKTIFPKAIAVVITANPLATPPEVYQHLGVLRFMQKPVRIDELINHLRPYVLAPLTPSAHEELEKNEPIRTQSPKGMVATLNNLSLFDVIQMKCLASWNGILGISNHLGTTGELHFRRGTLIHASAPGLKGLDALSNIISWKGGDISTISNQPLDTVTLPADTQRLLLDLAYAKDKAGSAA